MRGSLEKVGQTADSAGAMLEQATSARYRARLLSTKVLKEPGADWLVDDLRLLARSIELLGRAAEEPEPSDAILHTSYEELGHLIVSGLMQGRRGIRDEVDRIEALLDEEMLGRLQPTSLPLLISYVKSRVDNVCHRAENQVRREQAIVEVATSVLASDSSDLPEFD
jgi:hypothetical protein